MLYSVISGRNIDFVAVNVIMEPDLDVDLGYENEDVPACEEEHSSEKQPETIKSLVLSVIAQMEETLGTVKEVLKMHQKKKKRIKDSDLIHMRKMQTLLQQDIKTLKTLKLSDYKSVPNFRSMQSVMFANVVAQWHVSE